VASDIWSFGLNFALGDGVFFAADLQPFTQTMLDAWIARVRPHVATFARLTQTKAAFVLPDGLVAREGSGAFIQHKRAVLSVGGNASTAASGINQVSHAITTTTSRPGATGRGRFFLPAPGIGPDSATGQLPEATATSISTSMAGFIGDLNAALVIGPCVVASGGSAKQNLPPALVQVTGVRVGRRLDVIRSRANAIPELYKDFPVAV
jgi:hypothetical protein